jgi:hypothetical protein
MSIAQILGSFHTRNFTYVSDCLLVIMTYMGVPSIVTMSSIVLIFLFSFYTPLHVSALADHLQVEYTQSLMEAITLVTDPLTCYDARIYCICLLTALKHCDCCMDTKSVCTDYTCSPIDSSVSLRPVTYSLCNSSVKKLQCKLNVKLVFVVQISDSTLLPEIPGCHGSAVVKALCYKAEGRGFDTQ